MFQKNELEVIRPNVLRLDRRLAPRQHNSIKTSQRRRALDDTLSDLTDSAIEPQISRTDSGIFNHYANRSDSVFVIEVRLKCRTVDGDLTIPSLP